jgi:cytochrome c556
MLQATRFPATVLLGVVLGAGACSRKEAPAAQAQPTFRLIATIQDLMEGQIDPSADALWDSVAYIATEAGIEDRRPHTDEQWRAVRRSAVTLIETANLLYMPGRRVAVAGTPAAFGELSPAQIQRRIQADHDRFAQFARVLQEAGLKALTAIDAKDAQALMDAGGVIDEACEACHVAYWYPNQHSPGN